ncbi:hypothetical protein ZIOFF_045535 [Zingiber officinale]|uniref:Uncharacterized protein n=1 Tax=Zingiber officinale TaxID=94328 RepID=A0A8J5G0M8_ZINOF|nr:hypothetical protein ZIOFF_045535 [Zingiber officinale]
MTSCSHHAGNAPLPPPSQFSYSSAENVSADEIHIVSTSAAVRAKLRYSFNLCHIACCLLLQGKTKEISWQSALHQHHLSLDDAWATSNLKLPIYYAIVGYELFSRLHGWNPTQDGDFCHVQILEKEDVAFSYGMTQNRQREGSNSLVSSPRVALGSHKLQCGNLLVECRLYISKLDGLEAYHARRGLRRTGSEEAVVRFLRGASRRSSRTEVSPAGFCAGRSQEVVADGGVAGWVLRWEITGGGRRRRCRRLGFALGDHRRSVPEGERMATVRRRRFGSASRKVRASRLRENALCVSVFLR